MRSGGCPAGSGRALRLDPFALPVRYAASDAVADERVREIELHRTRVVVRRQLAGMRMAFSLPVSAFTGVGLCMMADGGGAALAVVLAHQDPGLALPSPNGAAGAPCSACRCSWRMKTAGATYSCDRARCASGGCVHAAAAAARSSAAARRSCCAAPAAN